MRIWVGNGSQNEVACNFCVDDIRFHPSSALMTTAYYYGRDVWCLPRLAVGPDGNPGELTEYDKFCMPAKTYQFSHNGEHVILDERQYYVQGDDAE